MEICSPACGPAVQSWIRSVQLHHPSQEDYVQVVTKPFLFRLWIQDNTTQWSLLELTCKVSLNAVKQNSLVSLMLRKYLGGCNIQLQGFTLALGWVRTTSASLPTIRFEHSNSSCRTCGRHWCELCRGYKAVWSKFQQSLPSDDVWRPSTHCPAPKPKRGSPALYYCFRSSNYGLYTTPLYYLTTTITLTYRLI